MVFNELMQSWPLTSWGSALLSTLANLRRPGPRKPCQPCGISQLHGLAGHFQSFTFQPQLGEHVIKHKSHKEGGHWWNWHHAAISLHCRNYVGHQIKRPRRKTDDPRNPSCQIKARARSCPPPTRKQIVGRHCPADRTKRSTDDFKHPNYLSYNASDCHNHRCQPSNSYGDVW